MNSTRHQALRALRARYLAPLQRGFTSFWSWWTSELRTMLPQSMQDAIAQRKQKLIIETTADGLRVRKGSMDDNREILCIPADDPGGARADMPRDVEQTILLLPQDKVLVKSLTLPLAAEENLQEVLAFEMDLHTPFTATKVCYDYLVTGRSGSDQTLAVDLVYSPRSVVDELLDSVSRHGVSVDVVTSYAGDGTNLRSVNLLPHDRRHSRRKSLHRLNLALAIACALLLVAAVTLPVAQKNAAIRSLEVQVEAAAADARASNQLRRDLEKMADASRFLASRKRSDILLVQVIDQISAILPDHTWITRLDISDTEIQLQGQSSASSSLISLIESSAMFQNVRFRSPVVQIANTDQDRFHLSADIIGNEPR